MLLGVSSLLHIIIYHGSTLRKFSNDSSAGIKSRPPFFAFSRGFECLSAEGWTTAAVEMGGMMCNCVFTVQN